jgi:hypothetical protein
MPNHFHIVLRASERPLGWVMQPIMRRLALLINRTRSRRGPVFEGRFRTRACADGDHLRRAIVYVHNNPMRKDLCRQPADYAWHSHAWYSGCPRDALYVGATVGLQLFASDVAHRSSEALTRNYLRYFAWRLEKDRCDELLIPCAAREPESVAGDAFFHDNFRTTKLNDRVRGLDLRDRALALLERVDYATELESLRRPYLKHPAARVRRELICALLQQGYQVGKIATLFRVSVTVVSRCASQLRYAGTSQKV